MILKTVKRSEIQADLICMNLIKRKLLNHHQLSYNDEQLLLLLFKDYAKVIKEVLYVELY